MSMTLEADLAVMRGIPFLRELSAEQLRVIAFAAEARSLPEKLLLYDEGQLLHSAYVVISGSLRGERRGKAGEEPRSREIGPGVLLGERALILDTRASESVRVEERSRVLQIRKAMFRRFLQDNPEVAIKLRTQLAGQLLQTSAELNALAQRLNVLAG